MRRLALLFAGVLIALATGCEKYIIPPPVIEEGVSYAEQVQPVFDDKCVSCHSGGMDPDLRPEESYEFLTTNGYVDTFRYFHPEKVQYSWWSYRFRAREKNAGWRIDYFFVSEDIIRNGWIKNAFIDNSIYGSDHCPVGLEIEY